jgi:hypothetical protein
MLLRWLGIWFSLRLSFAGQLHINSDAEENLLPRQARYRASCGRTAINTFKNWMGHPRHSQPERSRSGSGRDHRPTRQKEGMAELPLPGFRPDANPEVGTYARSRLENES